jgi:hypothetical protein
MQKKILPVIFFFLLIVACDKKKVPEQINVGYNYFPLSIGSYTVYEVDSLAKDDKLAKDTVFKFLIKEVIESAFTDNTGKAAFRIERYKKKYNPKIPYAAQLWELKQVWYANRTETVADRVEDNARYTKLIFPVKEGAVWDGNASNTLGEKQYKIIAVDQQETIGSNKLDSVASVLQSNSENLVETNYSIEKYARNVGMVYKQDIILSKQPKNNSDTPPFDDTVVTNYRTYRLIEYSRK